MLFPGEGKFQEMRTQYPDLKNILKRQLHSMQTMCTCLIHFPNVPCLNVNIQQEQGNVQTDSIGFFCYLDVTKVRRHQQLLNNLRVCL